VGQDGALVAPVDLRLRAGDDLEPAVQPRQLVRGYPQLGGDPRPGFLQIQLDPLIVTGEPVLLHQPLVDHRALEQQLRPQPGVDHVRERLHREGPSRLRRPLRRLPHLSVQVLTHRPPVQPGLPRDLRDAQPGVTQRTEPAQFEPPLRSSTTPRHPPPEPPQNRAKSRLEGVRQAVRHAAQLDTFIRTRLDTFARTPTARGDDSVGFRWDLSLGVVLPVPSAWLPARRSARARAAGSADHRPPRSECANQWPATGARNLQGLV
jgi:hypothetical protein